MRLTLTRLIGLRRHRLLRFLLVGGLNSLFGLAVYSGFIHFDSPAWLALIGGNVAGIAFNFITTGGLVFTDLAMARLPKFILCYVLLYFINLGLIHYLVPVVGGAIVAQVLLTIPMSLISYIGMARLVFADSAQA
jgi:putative flippase GtrA